MFFVLKNGRRMGPFSIDGLLEAVDDGRIDYEDDCESSGSQDGPQKVREVLDWDPPEMAGTTALSVPKPVMRKAQKTDAGPPDDPNAVLYAGHPSFVSFLKTLLLIMGSIVGGIWAGQAYGGIYLVAGLLVAIFGISYIQFERSMLLYLITPKRVELIKGFITKSSNEVRVQDIRAINVKKRGLLGFLGIATVEFASAGTENVEVLFSNIWGAQKVKHLVRRLQDVKRK